MTENQNELILTYEEVTKKIRRIAYQIVERNFKHDTIVLAGIVGQGFELGKLIYNQLHSIFQGQIHLLKINLDKTNIFQSDIKLEGDIKLIQNHPVIIIDDVLNTGTTLIFSLQPFLNLKVAKIEIAVLVNRLHLNYPIQANYTGYQLYTTVNQNVVVKLLSQNKGVYLHGG